MAKRRGGLQKNVSSIFQDAAMPDDIYVTPDPTEPAPESDPAAETSKLKDPPKTEATSVQDTLVSASDVPVAQPQSEPSQVPDGPKFSDSLIEGQMKKQKCEKSFSCYKSGLEDLCQTRVSRNGRAVQCLEPKKIPCSYRISTFFKRLCQCPIRIHIAKKLGK